MKKVAIITLTKDLNYGNRLQNYAVEQLLKRAGYTPSTLFNTTWTAYGYTKKWKACISIPVKKIINPKLGRSLHIAALFDDFNDRYIHFAEHFDINSEMDEIADQYDMFVTGSDQVWNPNWGYITEKEYLAFAWDKRTFALSASFGVDEIPDESKEIIAQYLNHITDISVRESQGAVIVKELTGRDVPVLIDPTMCIDIKEWNSMAKKPRGLKTKNYVLLYVLGTLSEEDVNTMRNQFRNRRVLILKNNCINEKIPIGPREFLYLISHAEYIVTDSFHGSVFSILFHKNFVVYYRKDSQKSMMSRIFTLLDKFNLEECLHMSVVDKPVIINKEKWDDVEAKLSVYRNDVNIYISNQEKSIEGGLYE